MVTVNSSLRRGNHVLFDRTRPGQLSIPLESRYSVNVDHICPSSSSSSSYYKYPFYLLTLCFSHSLILSSSLSFSPSLPSPNPPRLPHPRFLPPITQVSFGFLFSSTLPLFPSSLISPPSLPLSSSLLVYLPLFLPLVSSLSHNEGRHSQVAIPFVYLRVHICVSTLLYSI